MKRFHVHVAVHDLQQSIRFYSALFGAEPTVEKHDYAKWMLDDPRVNFAISTRAAKPGSITSASRPRTARSSRSSARASRRPTSPSLPQKGAACCYAKSDKYWTIDPQGVAWESFHTLGSVPVYGARSRARRQST